MKRMNCFLAFAMMLIWVSSASAIEVVEADWLKARLDDKKN